MGRQSQLFCDQFGRSVIALLLVFGNVCFVQGSDVTLFWAQDLEALQAIFAAWKDPPDLSSNLAGWNTSQVYPCQNLYQENFTVPNWRGVLCLKNNRSVDSNNETTWVMNIVSLSISNASIVGTLSPSIGNLKFLTSLELTGNPELTCPLPLELQDIWINVVDVHDNSFNGTVPNWNLWSLVQLDLSGNQFVGPFPFTQFSNMNYLQVLSIGNNFLEGPIPSYAFTSKTDLEKLDISNNYFTGELPDLSSMRKLIYLDVSGNYFVGPKPNLRNFQALQTANFARNNFKWTENLSDTLMSSACFVNPVKANNREVVIISVTTSVIPMLLVLATGVLLYKNRKYRALQVQFNKRFEEYVAKPTIFSYNELRLATRGFHDDMKLGQGGYGTVYKGIFPNGHVVAVKQLFVKTSHGLDDFSNEVVLITGMKHRNLVNLKGCCLREHQRLLVYEYVDNFDVDQVLLGTARQVVSWAVRLKICLGIAHGLHYLHALAHPRVIHLDIKASNVLLDKNMEPKIADFGLALLFPDEQSHIVTIHVAETQGYLAPEYASLGQLSDKVDVYSFGVLCLEIISGRRNIDISNDPEQVYLSKWAWILHEQDRLLDLVDPTLHLTDDEVRDVQRVINVCLLCIQNASEKRPSMARIASLLQNDTESEVLVPGEGKSYKPETRSQRGSVDYRNNSNSGLDSVSEEGKLIW